MIAYSLIVSGVVQGVGFRHYTREKAAELYVYGTVRNLANGTVAIHVEGEEAQMQKFLTWCHTGPSSASVTKLDYSQTSILGHSSFDIIRL